MSFPEGQGKVQISSAGGSSPRWTRGGSELLFSDFAGTVMSVAIETARGFRASTPRALFTLPPATYGWEVSANGERFLVNAPVVRSPSVPLSLVLDWAAALKH